MQIANITKAISGQDRLKSVPRSGFEPPHPYECHPLKMVRLPISPPGLRKKKYERLDLKSEITINVFVIPILISHISYLNGCARRETRTLKRQFSTASETATFTNFAIRAV
jgi:hypothetical protein